MQHQAWALKTVNDGHTYENLSTDEAMTAIRRAMHGLRPFEDERGTREQRSTGLDVPLAA